MRDYVIESYDQIIHLICIYFRNFIMQGNITKFTSNLTVQLPYGGLLSYSCGGLKALLGLKVILADGQTDERTNGRTDRRTDNGFKGVRFLF